MVETISAGVPVNLRALSRYKAIKTTINGKSTLSEQPGFCDFVFQLRWPVVPGFKPRCSWCSG